MVGDWSAHHFQIVLRLAPRHQLEIYPSDSSNILESPASISSSLCYEPDRQSHFLVAWSLRKRRTPVACFSKRCPLTVARTPPSRPLALRAAFSRRNWPLRASFITSPPNFNRRRRLEAPLLRLFKHTFSSPGVSLISEFHGVAATAPKRRP